MKPSQTRKKQTACLAFCICRPRVIVRRTIPVAVSLLAVFFSPGCRVPQYGNEPLEAVPQAAAPKNVILLIGDGLALPQISAGIYWKGNGRSVYERFPVVGFHKSHSSDDLITDSAAGATAFACGEKTYNGAIGLLPDGSPCPTLLEQLEANDFATGMVVACSAVHATPAAFIAHAENRAFTEAIALGYLKTPVDCFIGGGESYFNARPDKRNLIDSLVKRGYKIFKGAGFNKIPTDGSAPFMQFTAPQEPATAFNGRNYLPEATTVACNFLKKRSPKGFFLMVEGSQIDWALHSNDQRWLRSELLDFDAAILAALRFAAADGETLVLVTGDHECGGMSLDNGVSRVEFEPTFAEHLHTGVLVPVLAYGPGAAKFSGVYENTEIYFRIKAVFGL